MDSWCAEVREIKQKDGTYKKLYISSAAADHEKQCNIVLSKGQGFPIEGHPTFIGENPQSLRDKGYSKYFLTYAPFKDFFNLCKIKDYIA